MPKPKLHVNLDDDVLRELLFVAKHAHRIDEVVNLAGQVSETSDFDETVEAVAEHVGMPVSEVERLLQGVYNITRIVVRVKMDVPQFLEAATQAFEDRKGDSFTEADLLTWKDSLKFLRPAVAKIGTDHPFSVSRKADRLARSQQNIVYEMKIITDLRPVFNASGDTILRSVINYRLIVDYFDGSRVARSEFGLDATDVTELRKACERAELKTLTLKESLKGIPWASNLPKGEQTT
jgi:hypothetical protein